MNTLFVGQSLLKLKTVASTNDYVADMIKNSVVHEGTIVAADIQTNGKGQRGNIWRSEPYKNLTFSLVLYPNFLDATDHFYLNKAITIGIKRFVDRKVFDEVKIKWPNDVYLNELKIGGVLIENTLKGKRIGASIVGIGLNVNQEIFANDVPNPTSLKLETGVFSNLDFALEELAGEIEATYLKIKQNKKSLDDEFNKSLLGLNEWRSYKVKNKKLQLKAIGVDEYGKLITIDEDGNEHLFDFKEIEFMHT